MEEEKNEIVHIFILADKDGISAEEIYHPKRIFKIQEIMLGVGNNRKPVKFTKGFLQPKGEHQAEILPNGKLRIIR